MRRKLFYACFTLLFILMIEHPKIEITRFNSLSAAATSQSLYRSSRPPLYFTMYLSSERPSSCWPSRKELLSFSTTFCFLSTYLPSKDSTHSCLSVLERGGPLLLTSRDYNPSFWNQNSRNPKAALNYQNICSIWLILQQEDAQSTSLWKEEQWDH